MTSNLSNSINNIKYMDELSNKRTIIHRINSTVKLIVALAYIVCVISFGKYDVVNIFPLLFYPIIIMALAEIPAKALLKRVLVVSPFVIGVGIFNPIFDSKIYVVIMGLPISYGWVSFISLLIKCFLTVLATLILISTTGMNNISLALRKLGIPKIFVLQLSLTYRYISVLLEEAQNIWSAYLLRAPGQKGVKIRIWGSLIGHLLLRTFDKAQRVYQAMALRGFQGEYRSGISQSLEAKDIIFLFSWLILLFLIRFVNITELIGTFFI